MCEEVFDRTAGSLASRSQSVCLKKFSINTHDPIVAPNIPDFEYILQLTALYTKWGRNNSKLSTINLPSKFIDIEIVLQ